MKWAPKGFGGERRPPEHIKREGWQAQRVLVIEAEPEALFDERLHELPPGTEADKEGRVAHTLATPTPRVTTVLANRPGVPSPPGVRVWSCAA